MIHINTNKISMIKRFTNNTSSLNPTWLQHTNVNNNFELYNQYAHICQQHKQASKWVLFINPEESSIEQLSKAHGIDVSTILIVNYKNTDTTSVEVKLAQIKSVLSKGNCSAVILSNNLFEAKELAQLESSAKTGKTHCIIVEKQQLH